MTTELPVQAPAQPIVTTGRGVHTPRVGWWRGRPTRTPDHRGLHRHLADPRRPASSRRAVLLPAPDEQLTLPLWDKAPVAAPVRVAAATAHRPGRWLSAGVLVVFLACGVLAAARPPNRWSVTHYLFNYEHGFIKRGLFGELIRDLAPAPYTYSMLATIAWGVFGALIAALLLLVWRVARQDRQALILVAAFFASSGFIYLTHVVGYLDHVGLVLVAVCLLLPANPYGLVVRSALCVAGVLVHEAFLVCFLPLVIAQYVLAPGPHFWRRALTGAIVIGVPALAVGLWLAQSSVHMPVDDAVAWLQSEATNFPVRPDAVEVLSRDINTNTAMTADMRASGDYRHQLFSSLWATLPLVLFFMASSIGILRKRFGSRWGLVVPATIAVVASGSPWLMHFVAWDVVRFNALTLTTAFLVWVSLRRGLADGDHSQPKLWPVIVALVFLAGTATVPLFDGYQQDRAPYSSTIELWEGIAAQGLDHSVPNR